MTIHGRSRQQRYSKLADWEYIYQCARKAPDFLQVLGNGDIFSYLDWNAHKVDCSQLSTCMIARGALIKVCVMASWLLSDSNSIPSFSLCLSFFNYLIFLKCTYLISTLKHETHFLVTFFALLV